jgi:hypothetical protein
MTNRLLLVLALFGCGGATPAFQWPNMVECAGDVPEIIGRVSTVLIADGVHDGLSDDGKRNLVELGKDAGGEAVVCAVRRLVDDWLAPGSAMLPEQVDAAARGRGWLAEVGVQVAGAP